MPAEASADGDPFRTGLPAAHDLLCIGADDLAIRRNALAMEGGRGHAPLPHVQRLLAGEQSVAQQHARALHGEHAAVIPLVHDHDLLNQGWMIELVDVAVDVLEVDKVAVPLSVFRNDSSADPDGSPCHPESATICRGPSGSVGLHSTGCQERCPCLHAIRRTRLGRGCGPCFA